MWSHSSLKLCFLFVLSISSIAQIGWLLSFYLWIHCFFPVPSIMLLSPCTASFILDSVLFRSKMPILLSFISSTSLLRLSISLTRLFTYSFVCCMFLFAYWNISIMAVLNSLLDKFNVIVSSWFQHLLTVLFHSVWDPPSS